MEKAAPPFRPAIRPARSRPRTPSGRIEPGKPDGLKVDSIGRVYCTGPGGISVLAPDDRRIGAIRWPEQAVNFAFGGPDPRTLFC
jgi:sugar lactone lactonase YvrE